MELLEAAFTSTRDPMPWETVGGKVKGGGKWSKGKGKANQRPKQRIWNERRKEGYSTCQSVQDLNKLFTALLAGLSK